MYKSIVESCDTYYYMLANDMGVDAIHDSWRRSASAQMTGIDLEGEQRGVLPSHRVEDASASSKPEQQKWYAGETISLGIGQGYNSFTPLQLAQAMAMLSPTTACVIKPHLVKVVEDARDRRAAPTCGRGAAASLAQAATTSTSIKRAMVGVTQEGTGGARRSAAPPTSPAARPARRR